MKIPVTATYIDRMDVWRQEDALWDEKHGRLLEAPDFVGGRSTIFTKDVPARLLRCGIKLGIMQFMGFEFPDLYVNEAGDIVAKNGTVVMEGPRDRSIK